MCSSVSATVESDTGNLRSYPNRRNKYFQDAQAEMTKAQEDLSTQNEQLKDRSQVLEHTELIAPMDAVVNNIRINTLGGVVRAGEVVMELMPAGDNLVVEAKVSPTDIAFVEVGQLTTIKLDAYDSSIHGSMRGEVSYISPDVLVEETKQGTVSHFREGAKADVIRLRAGLTATVEIKAQDRTVLSYLTKPITKTINQSMGER
ncbi:MAG: HlyD family efflux transporter periplasmic adaptor subunit [Betaproteobacteria bacterium]|nr:HlyD family efflux transporter periplasmic adaptor subunit [Betaproteobacteria bacterium]